MRRILQPDLLTLAQIGLRHLGYDPGPIDGLEGPRTLAAYEAWKRHDPTSAREPGWMKSARGEMGVKEHVGEADHPRIVEYLHTTTLPEPYRNRDETNWCSAFVNWCLAQVGITGTNSAAARSWQRRTLGWTLGWFIGRRVRLFELTRPFYYVMANGDVITVPAGYRTDGASIPQRLQDIFPPFGPRWN